MAHSSGNVRASGASALSPSGQPSAIQASRAALSCSGRLRSFLNVRGRSAVSPAACHTGMVPSPTTFLTIPLCAFTWSSVSRANGPMPPARWHSWQFCCTSREAKLWYVGFGGAGAFASARSRAQPGAVVAGTAGSFPASTASSADLA